MSKKKTTPLIEAALLPSFVEVERTMEKFLTQMGLDWREDPNLEETPKRLARTWEELFQGLYKDPPEMKTFPATSQQMIIVRISGVSFCAHHFLPFFYKAWFGYIPRKRVVGMSKIPRLVRWLGARPQIQEDFTDQITHRFQKELNPLGCGAYMIGVHLCSKIRGVKDEYGEMTTTSLVGDFLDDPSVKSEFLDSIKHKSTGVDVL